MALYRPLDHILDEHVRRTWPVFARGEEIGNFLSKGFRIRTSPSRRRHQNLWRFVPGEEGGKFVASVHLGQCLLVHQLVGGKDPLALLRLGHLLLIGDKVMMMRLSMAARRRHHYCGRSVRAGWDPATFSAAPCSFCQRRHSCPGHASG